MAHIDLCKLRPGDIVFSRAPNYISRLIACLTWSKYSHAMIVVYPDVWFETDGAGSGFKLIEDVQCFTTQIGHCAIVAHLQYVKMDVLRPNKSVTASNILQVIQHHIALKYPSPFQFIPLLLPLQCFPRAAKWLMYFLSRGKSDAGGYCSQMISQILRGLYGLSVGGRDDHISPGMLRRRLLKSGSATNVDCSVVLSANSQGWAESISLQKSYAFLLTVTSKLREYQYPHDKVSIWRALANTFASSGIIANPKNFAISAQSLRVTLTRPQFFRMHDWFWPNKYS